MAVYLISYDLGNAKGPEYKDLENYIIKNIDTHAVRLTGLKQLVQT
ncbi:hypothetical protein FB597_1141 [Herbaspirillum sp. SJZ099]|nr:hypothetical protein FB597_1141 [Herbaspirillum sp. SJZ099]